jgi:cytochrome c
MRACLIVFLAIFSLIPVSARAAAIHDAAKKGDTVAIAAALDGGVDANLSNGLATPLYYAAAGGHLAAMKLLIERGAQVDAPSIWGPPLVTAASFGKAEAVEFLLGAGADPNGHFKTKTALHVSAQNGYLECVEALVEAGADVNAQTELTETPIHLAKLHKRNDVAAYLMAHGVILPKPPPISARLAASDAGKGKEVFSKACAGCHFAERGKGRKVGPALWNVVGRDKASLPAGGYSDALLAWEGDWNYEDLNTYLWAPMVTTPGVFMEISGVAEEADRADLIAYLRALSDEPLPLPGN